MNENIKKYPIFYQGEEYEIRIEEEKISVDYAYILNRYVKIYKISTRTYYLL